MIKKIIFASLLLIAPQALLVPNALAFTLVKAEASTLGNWTFEFKFTKEEADSLQNPANQVAILTAIAASVPAAGELVAAVIKDHLDFLKEHTQPHADYVDVTIDIQNGHFYDMGAFSWCPPNGACN